MKALGLCFVLLAALAPSAFAQKLNVSVEELRATQTGSVGSPVGSVFDLRNLLKVNINYKTTSDVVGGQTEEALKKLNAITDAGKEIAQGAVKLAHAGKDTPTEVGALAKLVQKSMRLIPQAERLNVAGAAEPGDDAVDPLVKPYIQIARGFAIYSVKAAKQLQDQVNADLQVRAASGTTGQVHATLTVIQSREARQGRTYAKDLASFLAVTDQERAYAQSLTPDQLQQNLKEWAANETKKIQNEYDTSVKPALDAVAKEVNDASSPALAAVNKALADIRAFKLDTATYQTVIQLETDVTDAKTKIDALLASVQNPPATFTDDIAKLKTQVTTLLQDAKLDLFTLFQLGQVQQIAQQVKDAVLGPGDSKAYTIGTLGDIRNPDVAFDLQNGDSVRVFVTEHPEGDTTSKPVTDLDQTTHAYRLGTNMLRTVTYDGYEQDNSHRMKFAPSINFLVKNFTRSLVGNTTQSIGIGGAWFPIGVDQQGTGANQQAIGVVASLLDDWVSVGYARNFGTNRNFLFVGVMVPLKF